ncbi:MAG: NADH-quinone oxidoreductase subunit NuoK [Nitrospirota bacterium]
MHALLYLNVSLLSIALVFLLMGAYLVAALEVIIYAGAIMIFFIFVIMMLNIAEAPMTKGKGWLRPEVWAGPALLSTALTCSAWSLPPCFCWRGLWGPITSGEGACRPRKGRSNRAMPIPAEHVLVLSGLLFALGLFGLLFRRDIIFILLSLEIMLNASGVAFVAAGARWGQPDGQVMFIFVLAMTAAELSVGLALVISLYDRFKTLDTDLYNRMKG